MIGTPFYIAPEVFNESPYSFEADIWSLGIILYELCCLEYPFQPKETDNDYLFGLMKAVKKGTYKDLPSQYSDELKLLLKHMLNPIAKKRPNINQVCSFPLIKDTIREVLDAKNFKDEFAHTILHKRDIFKEMKAAKKKAGKAGILPEDDIKSKKYEAKGIDQNTFDSVFSQYVDHVSNSKGKPGEARNPHQEMAEKYSAGSEAIAEEEDEHMTENQVDETTLQEAQKALMGRTKRPDMSSDQKEMDRICGLTKAQFQAEMMAQFGQDAFNQGYEILAKNKMLALEDAGPAKLDDMITPIIADATARQNFIKICGQYIFITGMKL